jgi:hypothetical protein
MQALLRNHLVPQLLKPKIRVGVGLERDARPGTNPLHEGPHGSRTAQQGTGGQLGFNWANMRIL